MSSYNRFEQPGKAVYAAFDDGWKRLRDDQVEPYELLLTDDIFKDWLLKAYQDPSIISVKSFKKKNKRGIFYTFYLIVSGNDLEKTYMKLGDERYHEILELPVAVPPPTQPNTLPFPPPKTINGGRNKKTNSKKTKNSHSSSRTRRNRKFKIYKK